MEKKTRGFCLTGDEKYHWRLLKKLSRSEKLKYCKGKVKEAAREWVMAQCMLCGTKHITRADQVRDGSVKKCQGCRRRIAANPYAKKGHRDHQVYLSLQSAKSRCKNKKTRALKTTGVAEYRLTIVTRSGTNIRPEAQDDMQWRIWSQISAAHPALGMKSNVSTLIAGICQKILNGQPTRNRPETHAAPKK
jgi:hypothetical protein